MFEVLLDLDFSLQQNTGLGVTEQRHSEKPEKAGTIMRASSEFYGHGWLHLPAVEVSLASCGGFGAIFCVEWNRHLTPTKNFTFSRW